MFRNSVCGTYEYMPPEVVREENHGKGVDVWGLGILLYEMLHGVPPFKAQNLEEIKQEIESKEIHIDSKFGPYVKNLLELMLEYEIDKRCSVDQVLEHPLIKKNIEKFERVITKDEFDIMKRYYYMNSGGNQLITHNSVYARQLKRDSVALRLSHLSAVSYKSYSNGVKSQKNSITSTNQVEKDNAIYEDIINIPNDNIEENEEIVESMKNMNFKKKPDLIRVDTVTKPSSSSQKVIKKSLKDIPSDNIRKSPLGKSQKENGMVKKTMKRPKSKSIFEKIRLRKEKQRNEKKKCFNRFKTEADYHKNENHQIIFTSSSHAKKLYSNANNGHMKQDTIAEADESRYSNSDTVNMNDANGMDKFKNEIQYSKSSKIKKGDDNVNISTKLLLQKNINEDDLRSKQIKKNKSVNNFQTPFNYHRSSSQKKV